MKTCIKDPNFHRLSYLFWALGFDSNQVSIKAGEDLEVKYNESMSSLYLILTSIIFPVLAIFWVCCMALCIYKSLLKHLRNPGRNTKVQVPTLLSNVSWLVAIHFTLLWPCTLWFTTAGVPFLWTFPSRVFRVIPNQIPRILSQFLEHSISKSNHEGV